MESKTRRESGELSTKRRLVNCAGVRVDEASERVKPDKTSPRDRKSDIEKVDECVYSSPIDTLSLEVAIPSGTATVPKDAGIHSFRGKGSK